MTIEHLAPQNGTNLDPDVVASIGNLILVDESLNRRLGNKKFSAKQPILARQNGVWVDDTIKTATSWGRRQINARAAALAREAYEDIWAF